MWPSLGGLVVCKSKWHWCAHRLRGSSNTWKYCGRDWRCGHDLGVGHARVLDNLGVHVPDVDSGDCIPAGIAVVRIVVGRAEAGCFGTLEAVVGKAVVVVAPEPVDWLMFGLLLEAVLPVVVGWLQRELPS
jgi:hypothetical protein